MQLFGASLTSFSVAAIMFAYGSDLKADSSIVPLVNQATHAPAPAVVVTKPQKGSEVASEALRYDINSDFSIAIPSIKAYSNIVAGVDPFDQSGYSDALKEGVAHAEGTAFPDQSGTVFLFAHSTDSPLNIARYNAVFYALKDLQVGELVYLFYNHQKYIYLIRDKQIVSAKDTSWLNSDGTNRLILQTCYPPGTTWKRLLIIAKPIS